MTLLIHFDCKKSSLIILGIVILSMTNLAFLDKLKFFIFGFKEYLNRFVFNLLVKFTASTPVLILLIAGAKLGAIGAGTG